MNQKLCKCGCGNPAPVAKVTNSKWGHVKGKPVNYIHGHHRRKSLIAISDCDLYWLAGLLEGEGSFYPKRYLRKPKFGKPWIQICPTISVCMNDRDIINRAAALMGNRVWRSGKMFTTSTTGPRAITLMNRLLTLLGKRRQNQITRTLSKSTPPHVWTITGRKKNYEQS